MQPALKSLNVFTIYDGDSSCGLVTLKFDVKKQNQKKKLDETLKLLQKHIDVR